jgi:acyl-CoA synthetase (AMP-forming)/AMP-acid ligase II
MTLGELIRRAAMLYGPQQAVVFEGRSYTYAEHASRIYRLANALIARGIRQQERVAILARNCTEYMEVFGAGEVAGFIVVNLNIRLATPELVAICGDCRPSVLIFTEEFAGVAASLREGVPDIREMISIGGATGAFDYEGLLAEASAEEPSLRSRADHVAHLMYTSGTTGGPKGVMLSHSAFLDAARVLSHESGVGPTARGLIVMPFFHLGGKIEQMAFSFLGGTIVLKAAFEPVDILETIQREKVTVAHFAPIMVQRIVETVEAAPGRYDTSTLRCVHYASAPMPVPLLRRALDRFGPIFVQVYGMTECIVGTMLKAHQHRPDGDDLDRRRLGSAGQPCFGNDLRVVRPDGSACDLGEVGEILFRSPSMMRGYWNKHPATIDAMRDGWIYTQDLGSVDAGGFLYVVDRKKDMIISGGENIHSWEVEEALRTHPAIAEVAVIAVPDPQWGESVKACVVVRDGQALSETDVIEYCRSRIASYKKPRSVDFVETLPRLFNGKIDKKALRGPYWQGRERQVS